jgi:hypothetical protein
MPAELLWPAGTVKWPDGKSVETAMVLNDDGKSYSVRLGPFKTAGVKIESINFVFHYADGSWGSDRQISIK